jgi:hypothetical protein
MAEPHQPSIFPPELVDRVIDHLCDDDQALAACSLVCRSWVRRSFHHLLKEVSLELCHVNSRSFVADGKSNILPHIKLVAITGDLDMAEMPQALSLLRCHSVLRVLVLDSVNLVPNTSDIFKFVLPVSGLEILRLKNCQLHPSTGILDTLSALPGLKRLNLYHKKTKQECHIHPVRYNLPTPPRLTTMELGSPTDIVPYLELLDVASSQLTLHTLSLDAVYAEDARRAIEILAAHPSLRELNLTLVFLPHGKSSDVILMSESIKWLPLSIVLPSLGLPTLTNLRSLSFVFFPRDLTLLCTFITDLLWNLPSIQIEKLSLKFLPLYDTVKANVVKPSETAPDLPLLKEFRIDFDFDSSLSRNYDWVGEMLMAQFLTYHERGILVI